MQIRSLGCIKMSVWYTEDESLYWLVKCLWFGCLVCACISVFCLCTIPIFTMSPFKQRGPFTPRHMSCEVTQPTPHHTTLMTPLFDWKKSLLNVFAHHLGCENKSLRLGHSCYKTKRESLLPGGWRCCQANLELRVAGWPTETSWAALRHAALCFHHPSLLLSQLV